MNKSELIDYIAAHADLSKTSASRAFDAALEGIMSALSKLDPVTIVGFGTFKVSERKARSGRNPQTGAVIQIKASRVPSFKAGKVLKDAVQEKK